MLFWDAPVGELFFGHLMILVGIFWISVSENTPATLLVWPFERIPRHSKNDDMLLLPQHVGHLICQFLEVEPGSNQALRWRSAQTFCYGKPPKYWNDEMVFIR